MKKLAILLFLCLPAFSQNVRYDSIAFGPKGPIANATIAVCTQPAATSTQPCTPLAALCSSLTDATCTQPNPFFADALGNFHFYLAPVGTPITIQIYGPGVAIPLVLSDQLAGVGTSGGGGGVFPTSTVSPTSLAFGSIALGSTSAAQVVTLTNTGTPQISISSIAITGDFAESTTCGSVLAQASSCTISVTFSPSATGARTGTLTITSNAASNPQSVPLSGTGLGTVGSPVTWSSAALTPATPTITIPNTLQMKATYTDSTGASVTGSLRSYWQDTGGGAASSWTLVNGPGNVASYKTAFNTTASKNLGPVSNTLHNLLVVKAMGYNAGGAQTFTISDTNVDTFTCTTLIQFSGNTRNTQICSAVINATASNTITCAVSTGYSACEAEEWSGNATVAPLDVAAGQGGAGTANMSTPSFTTAGTNELITGHCYDPAGSGTDTPGSGYTTDFTITSGVAAIGEHQVVSAAGTYSLSATDAATGQNWACDAAAFKPATAGTGVFSIVDATGLVTAQSAGNSTIQAIGGTVAQSASSIVASGTTATVTMANAQIQGNTNIVKVSWGSATGTITSVTDSAGNTYACQSPEQANSLSVALCVASPISAFSGTNGNIITVTMGQTTSNIDLIAEERNFTVASSVLDGAAVNATGASGNATANVTTVNATDVVVTGLGLAQTVNTVNAPFSVDATSAGGDAIISAPVFSASTVSPTANLAGGAWVLQAIALKVLGASTSATISAQAVTNVYYMAPSTASPPGNDSNACTQSLPCLSFSHIEALLKANCPGAAGCQVILENGLYNVANGTGLMTGLNCNTGGTVPNGTASAPIIWSAQNEKQAEVLSTGGVVLGLSNCSYYQFSGIRFQGADNTAITNPDAGTVALLVNIQHSTFTRNGFYFQNRFGNNQDVALEYGSCNNQFVENDMEYFLRWGIYDYSNACSTGNGNEFQRNYVNSNGWNWVTGAYGPSDTSDQFCFGNYGSQHDTWENNIGENCFVGISEQSISGATSPSVGNNTFLGNLVLGNKQGMNSEPHDNTTASAPFNNTYTNNVVFNATNYGWRDSNGINITVGNMTVRNPCANPLGVGVVADSQNLGDGAAFSSVVTNTQTYGNFSSFGIGASNGTGNWNHLNSYPVTSTCAAGNAQATAYSFTGSVTSNQATSNNPSDSCIAWVSTSSPMHNAGTGGNTDIGANVLFQYNGGTLGSTALWNSAGQFAYCGAKLLGVNDKSGSSCYDVGTRLNVNQNGCAFPGTYTPAP